MEKAHRAEVSELKAQQATMELRLKELKGMYEIESAAHAEI